MTRRVPQLEQPALVAQAHRVAMADLVRPLKDVIARIDHQEKELDHSLKAPGR